MGRAPCCEKMGLKKGSWSQEEDQVLISYIQQHGHPNWRALPKRAGLLRCGKSCRLRWINYLRPDIKRGNFSKDEEDTIIHLHEMLGNRWSEIAANLPGRTDNEIKNVWHTHLKKRTNHVSEKHHTKSKRATKAPFIEESIVPQRLVEQDHNSRDKEQFLSNIQPSSSESSLDSRANSTNHETFLDDSFWLEALSGEGDRGSIMEHKSLSDMACVEHPQTSLAWFKTMDTGDTGIGCSADEVYLWHDVFTRIEELTELPEF